MIEVGESRRRMLLTALKAVVLFACAYWVYEKLNNSNQLSADEFKKALSNANLGYLTIAFILFWINWGLEAIKWQKLMARTEQLSFAKSQMAVFAGVTLSAFIPFRAGSFIGRILFIDSKHKIRAIPASVVGNIMQLGTTLFFGTVALFLSASKLNIISNDDWKVKSSLFVGLFVLAFVLVLYKPLARKINLWVRKTFHKKKFRLFSLYQRKELLKVAVISALRYFIFSAQYFIILRAFGVDLDSILLIQAIFVIFLIQSFLPGFILLEVGVRTAVPLFVLAELWPNELGIVAASLCLYVLNILLAMCIGALSIAGLKIRKRQ